MHTAWSLQNKEKKSSHHIFIQQKKNQKIYVLVCTLAVSTSLLEPWELGQYFKNSKKIFLSSFSIWIMNLYVRRIPDIKNIFFI